MLIYREQIIMEQINPAAENQDSSKGHFTPQTNPELAYQKQGQMGHMGERVVAMHATSNGCDLTLNFIGDGITSGVFRKVIGFVQGWLSHCGSFLVGAENFFYEREWVSTCMQCL